MAGRVLSGTTAAPTRFDWPAALKECGLAAFVALVLFLKRTTIGVAMRAASEDFLTARLLGIRANYVIAAAFAPVPPLAPTACSAQRTNR